MRPLLSLLIFSVCAFSQQISITGGITDDQVIQRNRDGNADLELTGTASGAEGRAVEARLRRKQLDVDGFSWRALAKVANGKWNGKLAGIPAGGPYRLEVRIPGTDAADETTGILVGDIWILAGQSNMEGRGFLVEALPPHPMVHSFDMKDDWLVAEEPLHTRVNAKDPVYWFLNAQKVPTPYTGDKLRDYLKHRDRGTGLGLPFALEMVRRTGVPIGLVPCALGGTSMNQWSPALKEKGGESLYGATLRRIRAAGPKVKGMIWYQGESDATAKRASEFQAKFEKIVAAFREDTGQPDLPFYYVQIGRFVMRDQIADQWNMVQEIQRKSESRIPHARMAVSLDLSLVDSAHADASSLNLLGRRVANLACHGEFPNVPECAALKVGPRPVSASYKPASDTYREKMIRVVFSEVNGKLRAAGNISGFSVHTGGSGPLPIVYETSIDPDDPSSVLVRLGENLPAGAVLHYGYGTDPYCNLQDEAGMAVPAFGPMTIER